MTADFRKTPPASLAPIAFQIPNVKRATLSNGMRLVMFSDQRVPLINLRMILRCGDINDPSGYPGITSATAAMLNEGTQNYTSKQLAEEVERLGASLGASAGADSTVVAASALSLYTDDIVRLFGELVLRPTFPEDEFELYKKNTVEGLKFQRSQAGFLADEQFARLIYGDHPYSIVSPSPSDIENLSRADVESHHRSVFQPGTAVLIAVGDFEAEALVAVLERELAEWTGKAEVSESFPIPPMQNKRRLVVVDRPGSAQSNMLLGNIALRRDDPDYFPSLLLNQILGAGASSRLFMNLREEKGYTYGAYSKFNTRRFGGDFEASAEVRTEVTGESLNEFMKELTRIREEVVASEELQDAKNYLTGVFPLRAETQDGLTNLIVHQEVYSLPSDYLQTYRDNISRVTAEDVQRVARNHIHPEALTIVIVGDGAEILKQCSNWADQVTCFDTDGAPMDPASLAAAPAPPAVDLSGSWLLTLDFQGQNVEVALKLEQSGSRLGGAIESVFGTGTVSSGKVSGSSFTASAETDLQGQVLEMSLSGSIVNGELSGSIASPAVPAEVPFKGVRKQ